MCSVAIKSGVVIGRKDSSMCEQPDKSNKEISAVSSGCIHKAVLLRKSIYLEVV